MNTTQEFVIVAPPYSPTSAGIVVLHELCHSLIEAGFACHIVLLNPSQTPWAYHYNVDGLSFNPALRRSVIDSEDGLAHVQAVLQTGITIYPEIVTGNPLNAKHVVRYFLNADGVMTGRKSNFEPADFCLTYNPMYFPNAHAVLHKPIYDPLFQAKGCRPALERTVDVTYIGKGGAFAECFVIDNTVHVVREWPSTKRELAALLKGTRYFYSWDSLTSTNLDAVLCGAIVVLLQDKQIELTTLETPQGGIFPLPFIRGVVSNGNVSVNEIGEYEAKREAFICDTERLVGGWTENVKECALKMLLHFGLRTQ